MSIVRIELQPCWLISFELKSNFCMTFKEPSSKNPAATSLTPLSPIPHPCKFRMIRNCDCYKTCDKPRHPCMRVFFFCEAPILDPSQRFIRLQFLANASKIYEAPLVVRLLYDKSNETILKVVLRTFYKMRHESSPKALFERLTCAMSSLRLYNIFFNTWAECLPS